MFVNVLQNTISKNAVVCLRVSPSYEEFLKIYLTYSLAELTTSLILFPCRRY